MLKKWNDVVFTDESRFCLQNHDDRIKVWRHRGERLLNCCIMHRHTDPAFGMMDWGGIGLHCHNPLVRIAGTLNSQCYSFEVLELVFLPYIERLPLSPFPQDNARVHVDRIVQEFFTHQVELLPWIAYSPDLSLIENMWSMLA
ncbi:transposable element Tcb2 transposase [Trichonephila clavipes]|nr:transposable element Tcb2 transposase [Trichonephila clavipes]